MRNQRAPQSEFHRPTRTSERARFLRAVLDLESGGAPNAGPNRASSAAEGSASEAADATAGDGVPPTGPEDHPHPAS